MKKPLPLISLLILPCILIISCSKQESEPNGKIHISIDVEEQFSRESFNSGQTTVNWGCLSITNDSTACIYYYDGEIQVDGNISPSAIKMGPASFPGTTFIYPLNSFVDLQGGPRAYSYFSARFLDDTGSTIGIPVFDSGQIDLHSSSNSDENLQWIVTFKLDSIPNYEIIE